MTYNDYTYIYIVIAVVVAKIIFWSIWICMRTQRVQNRRRTVIIRQIRAPQQVPYDNFTNPTAGEWQGPYPQVTPAGVTVVNDPRMGQPPPYSEAVAGGQGPK